MPLKSSNAIPSKKTNCNNSENELLQLDYENKLKKEIVGLAFASLEMFAYQFVMDKFDS